MTRKAFGRTFKEPSCRFDSLVDETLREYVPAWFLLPMSLIPLAGIGAPIAAAGYSVVRMDNEFNDQLMAWKVSVYGTILQILSLVVVYVAVVR